MTLTDAQLAEIEADLHNRPLIVLEVDVTHLIAALRASRKQLAKIGEWAHPDGIDRECYICGEVHGRNPCPCPAHALGEEAT